MATDSTSWKAQSNWKKLLIVTLALTIIGILAATVYVMRQSSLGERFTDFYILGLEGEADQYPTTLSIGQEGRLLVGIVNNEGEAVNYRLEITLNDEPIISMNSIALKAAERWEQEMGFTPVTAGTAQEVKLSLYRTGETDVYRSLLLTVDVS